MNSILIGISYVTVFAETMETNGDAPSNEGKTEPTEGDL